MSFFVAKKTYSNANILTEAQLDDLRLSIEDYVNKNGLANDNVQDNGLTLGNFINDSVKNGKISNNTITSDKLAVLGQQLSSSSGTFSTTSSSATDVTNLSVSITTTGRPVAIMLVSDASGSVAKLTQNGGSVDDFDITFMRDATNLVIFNCSGETGSNCGLTLPPGSFFFIDNKPGAGTYTYKVQANTSAAAVAIQVEYTKLLVWEM